jgi:hypothetical protein
MCLATTLKTRDELTDLTNVGIRRKMLAAFQSKDCHNSICFINNKFRDALYECRKLSLPVTEEHKLKNV